MQPRNTTELTHQNGKRKKKYSYNQLHLMVATVISLVLSNIGVSLYQNEFLNLGAIFMTFGTGIFLGSSVGGVITAIEVFILHRSLFNTTETVEPEAITEKIEHTEKLVRKQPLNPKAQRIQHGKKSKQKAEKSFRTYVADLREAVSFSKLRTMVVSLFRMAISLMITSKNKKPVAPITYADMVASNDRLNNALPFKTKSKKQVSTQNLRRAITNTMTPNIHETELNLDANPFSVLDATSSKPKEIILQQDHKKQSVLNSTFAQIQASLAPLSSVVKPSTETVLVDNSVVDVPQSIPTPPRSPVLSPATPIAPVINAQQENKISAEMQRKLEELESKYQSASTELSESKAALAKANQVTNEKTALLDRINNVFQLITQDSDIQHLDPEKYQRLFEIMSSLRGVTSSKSKNVAINPYLDGTHYMYDQEAYTRERFIPDICTQLIEELGKVVVEAPQVSSGLSQRRR